MKKTEQASGQGYPRGRNVGLWLQPEDYARLEKWGQERHRKVANAARTIILERLELDERLAAERLAAERLAAEEERAEQRAELLEVDHT